MNDQPLTIDNLGDLDDGTVRHLINKALQEALDRLTNLLWPILPEGVRLLYGSV